MWFELPEWTSSSAGISPHTHTHCSVLSWTHSLSLWCHCCSRRRGWGKVASPNTPTCLWSCTYSSRCLPPCLTPTCVWHMPWRRSRSSCSLWVWRHCFVVFQWEFSVNLSVWSSLLASNIHCRLRNHLCNDQPKIQKWWGCNAKIGAHQVFLLQFE